jgi:pyruvate dehydrogenase E1 component beta subunit
MIDGSTLKLGCTRRILLRILQKAQILEEGKDVTIVASSYSVLLARRARELLLKHGIDAEIVDLRSIKPIDIETIVNSVKKTGRLVVVDGGWKTGGVAAEVMALTVTEGFEYLKVKPVRITLPDAPAPASRTLEKVYYPTEVEIVDSVISVCEEKPRRMK